MFIDGDFWHGWRFPAWKAKIPAFWQDKIEKNRQRDARSFAALRRHGWKVIRLWEHAVKVDAGAQVDRMCAALAER